MKHDSIFKPQEVNIKRFISNKYFYRIPDFQRSYTWDNLKTNDLILSISKSTKKNQLFLGTVYFHNKDGIYNITDGQQRIITLFLTINALRLLGHENLKEYLYDRDEKAYIDIYEAVPLHNMLFKSKDIYEIEDIKENLDDITLTKLQIIENQENIYKYLKENPELQTTFMEGIKHSYIILIDVPVEKNMYRIFRNINSKGAPLTDIDIIKNAFFEMIVPVKSIQFEKQHKYTYWRKIENNLLTDRREIKAGLNQARKNLETNMTITLNWFLNFILNSQISTTDFQLAKEYEKYLSTDGVNALTTLKELSDFSSTSCFVLFPTQHSPSQKIPKLIHPYIIMLYNMNFKQHIPIFLSLYYRLINKNKFQGRENEILIFCDKFYLYHFVFTVLLSDRGSKIGKKYSKQALKIFTDDVLDFNIVYDFQNANFYEKETISINIDKRLFYIKDKPKRVNKLENNLKDYRFYVEVDQIRDFLTFLEYKLTASDVSIVGIRIESIEHIFDASIEYENLDNFKLMSFLPLETQYNRECEGLDFDQKIQIYSKSKYILTKKFVELYKSTESKTPSNIRRLWKNYICDKIIEFFNQHS